jgi:prophage antirepressor-like protein
MNATSLIQFAGESFEVLAVNGRKAMTAEAIGKKFGYAEPRKQVINLLNAHKDEFEDGIDTSVIKLMTEAGTRETVIFYDTGAYLLAMFLNKPEGKRYRKIFKHILAGVAANPEKARRPYMTGERKRALIAAYDQFIESERTAEDQAKAAAEAKYLALLEEHVALQKENIALLQSRLAAS